MKLTSDRCRVYVLLPMGRGRTGQADGSHECSHRRTCRKDPPVLEADGVFPYRVFLLANPYRVVIDLPNISRAPFQRLEKPKGAIANYRFGLFRPGNSRVVIDVTGPVEIVRHAVLAGGRKNQAAFSST